MAVRIPEKNVPYYLREIAEPPPKLERRGL
jgi:hypothetical protein